MFKTRQMRLLHYGLAVAAAFALLPGCSNEELAGPAIPEYIPGDSEVEIRFATQTAEVSTTVDKRLVVDDNTRMEMGVFCLARGKQESNAPDINWFAEEDNYDNCLMKNVKATKDGLNLTWEGQYFYPISQYYMYEFYGYYPYSEDVTYTSTPESHRAVVNYTLDGTQDIVWGRATLQDKYAYSARYFREQGADAQVPIIGANSVDEEGNPHPGMKHLLTRLKFKVTTGSEPGGDGEKVFDDAALVSVKSISIVDAVQNVGLVVADWEMRDDQSKDNWHNRLAVVGDTVRAEFKLRESDTDDSEMQLVSIPTDLNTTKDFGGSIMLLPAGSYLMKVVLHKADGSNDGAGADVETETPIKVTSVVGEPGTGIRPLFNAGYTYTVTIKVNDFKEAKAEANVSEWQVSDYNPGVVEL